MTHYNVPCLTSIKYGSEICKSEQKIHPVVKRISLGAGILISFAICRHGLTKQNTIEQNLGLYLITGSLISRFQYNSNRRITFVQSNFK